jgi:hypothetical protein
MPNLLLPLSRVESLICERASLRDAAVGRVAGGVGDKDLDRSLLFFAVSSRALGGIRLVIRRIDNIFPVGGHHDRHPKARLASGR